MLTKLIVRTPALCLAKDRSFPSAAPIRAAMTSRSISRYSVAAETGQVSIWGGKAGAVDATTSDAKDHLGKTVVAARTRIMLGKALRTNPRRNLLLSLLSLLVHDANEGVFVATLIAIEAGFCFPQEYSKEEDDGKYVGTLLDCSLKAE